MPLGKHLLIITDTFLSDNNAAAVQLYDLVHERPEGMDEGTLIISGLNKDRIIQSIEVVTSQHREKRTTKIVSDYDMENISIKVLRIILSYVDYINRTVWHKGIGA